jgi:pimeloyl-ACP methyl ester carboxylesterase
MPSEAAHSEGTPQHFIYHDVAGAGVGAVLTHGFGDSSETWREQRPVLARHYAAHCWDLLGHGRSERPEDPDAYSRDAAVAALERIAAGCAGPVILIGHSLGGYLSQCLALSRPERVRALVLINTGPGFRDAAARERWNSGARKALPHFDVPPAAVGLVEQHDSFVIDQLDRIRVPVLAIAGGRDRGYHGALSYYRRRLPDVESVVVEDAGHHVHRTHAEQVNAAILSFLERRGVGP